MARDEVSAALIEISHHMPAGFGRSIQEAVSWVAAHEYDPTLLEACAIVGNRDNAMVFLATIRTIRAQQGRAAG